MASDAHDVTADRPVGTSARRSPGARFGAGLGWGIVATIAMSVLMILAFVTGVSPMPAPIPAALVGRVFGSGLPQPVHVVLAAASHLVYGGVAGGILALLTRRVTVLRGLAWGVLLWAVMGVAWLPFLGWGLFGVAAAPPIAVATLVLHLVYGATLGGLLDRS